MVSAEQVGRLLGRLVERGVLPAGVDPSVEILPGGVSADTYIVSAGTRRLVVKEALSRLRVEEEWTASPARVLVEADALAFARGVRPHNVPEVVDVDAERLVIVMTAAPSGMDNWKAMLLRGEIEPAVARDLATALADWHGRSSSDEEILGRFATDTYFFELRTSPFLLRVAEAHPDLAPHIAEVVDRMDARPICLVHGDFSPKNVLVGGDSFWVLDWETAHTGDPTFDLAFLLSHLVCKAIRRPADAGRYRACADAFTRCYLERTSVPIDWDGLTPLVGSLVLARVDGKSRVDYLAENGRRTARALGRSVLTEGVRDSGRLWDLAGA